MSLPTSGLLAVLLASASPEPIAWTDWSDAVFQRARAEGRFVLLDLGAVWCHWCHVMEETTYEDPKVVELVRARYVAVRVDQDARPDLSNRYEEYGWPATVIFDAQGGELAKFQGYVPPGRMASLLQAIIEDPTPGPSVTDARPATVTGAREPRLTGAQRAELEDLLALRYDTERGGWGFTHKFLDWDAVEHCMLRAREGDARAEAMARETLAKQTKLIDPVWGGVSQYSDSGDWEHPHFEKIMQFQAENLRIYSMAHRQWRDPSHLKAARDIHRYLTTFLLGPEGAFYTSQDADLVRGQHSGEYYALSDAERRKLGVPRVDTHRYARENAWAVNALVAFHEATGEAEPLRQALGAARWMVANRALPGGGFRHDEQDAGGPYMGDTVAAGRAFLGLFGATKDAEWLRRAEEAAAFLSSRFESPGAAGFVTSAGGTGNRPQRDENILAARLGAGLYGITRNPAHRELAERAMRYLAAPEIARQPQTGGVLLADRALAGLAPATAERH
jgi:uncharacterized protein YyaL (SSP411 family)